MSRDAKIVLAAAAAWALVLAASYGPWSAAPTDAPGPACDACEPAEAEVAALAPAPLVEPERLAEPRAIEAAPVEPRQPVLEVFMLRGDAPILALELTDWMPSRAGFTGCGEAWQDKAVRKLYARCREHWALRQYVMEYHDRELARWQAREPSVPLDDELQPAARWMEDEFGTEVWDLWEALSRYSHAAIDSIRDGEPNRAERELEQVHALLLTAACFPEFYAEVERLCGRD